MWWHGEDLLLDRVTLALFLLLPVEIFVSSIYLESVSRRQICFDWNLSERPVFELSVPCNVQWMNSLELIPGLVRSWCTQYNLIQHREFVGKAFCSTLLRVRSADNASVANLTQCIEQKISMISFWTCTPGRWNLSLLDIMFSVCGIAAVLMFFSMQDALRQSTIEDFCKPGLKNMTEVVGSSLLFDFKIKKQCRPIIYLGD